MHNAFHLFECHQPQSITVLIDFCVDVVKRLLQFTGIHCINLDPNVTAHYRSSYQMMGIKQKRETCFKCIKCENEPSLCVAPCFREFHENN